MPIGAGDILDGRFAVSDYDELDVTVAGDRLHLKRRAFARQTTMA